MNETITTLESLIKANQEVPQEQRTPFLDMAMGGLRTARENLIEHAKRAKAQQAAPAEKQPSAAAK